MREKIQGIVALVIVVFIAIPFLLWGVQYYLRGKAEGDVVAKIDGVEIKSDYVQHIFNRVQQNEMALLQKAKKDIYFDQKTQAALKDKIIQQVVRSEVLLRFANKLGLYVGKQQLEAAVAALPIFQENGSFSQERYQRILSNLAYAEHDFITELQNSLIINQLELGIKASSFVLPNEVDDAVKLLKQRRDFGYFRIDLDRFLKRITPTAADIKQYYDQHIGEFMSPEKISIEYIELNVAALTSKIKSSDKVLQQFYSERQELFRDKQTKKVMPFSAVKAKVKAAYEHQALQQMLSDYNEKLSDLTYTNSSSLAPAASALGLSIKSTELFTRQGAKSGFISNPKIIRAAFGASVLQQGYNSNVVEIGDNDLVVLRMKQHIPESALPIDKVRETISLRIRQQRALELAKQQAQVVFAALSAGQSPQMIAQKYNLTWQAATHVLRPALAQIKGKAINDASISITQEAFEVPIPAGGKSEQALVDLQGKGYAIVSVSKVYDGVAKDSTAKERQALNNDLGRAEADFEYESLVNELMQKAKIDVKKSESTAAGEE